MQILAIDLGGTSFKSALIDDEGNISNKFKLEMHPNNLDELWDCFDKIISQKSFKNAEGIALSMPGQIDQENGIAITAGAYSDFISNLPIGKILSERYGKKVVVDNDGKCAANAELWLGSLKDVRNGLVYGIGTGIAGGIIINHQIYKGSHFSSGEFSVPLVNLYEKANGKNFSACHLSTNSLIEKYKQKLKLSESVNGIEFFNKVNTNDSKAIDTLGEFCRLTANYFFNLQCCFDVEKIAVGGGISAQPVLIQMLKQEVDNIFDNIHGPFTKPEIVRCQFENDANLLGAVKFYLDA